MSKHKAVRFSVMRKRWIAAVAALGLSLSGSLVASSVAQASNAACNVTPTDFGAKHIVSFTSVGSCDWTVPAGVSRVEVQLRPEDHNMPKLPWIEEENFNPSYLVRDLHKMPKRGDKPEWRHNQDYWAEKDQIPATDLTGAEFKYS